MKYYAKEALLSDITSEFSALSTLLDNIPPAQYLEPGVWGEDWNVRDLIAPTIPAPGYNVRETPRLNRDIWRRYCNSDPTEMRQRLRTSHQQIVRLAQGLTQEQLLQPGHFAWTRRNGLVTYLGANTSSHYRFAQKVLKRWSRQASQRSEPHGIN